MLLATKLYQDSILIAEKAAKIVELSKKTFVEVLGNYGVSLFSQSTDNLYSDIKNA